jgi:hypothetical protein
MLFNVTPQDHHLANMEVESHLRELTIRRTVYGPLKVLGDDNSFPRDLIHDDQAQVLKMPDRSKSTWSAKVKFNDTPHKHGYYGIVLEVNGKEMSHTTVHMLDDEDRL